ncbi:TfoX/Sxy family protein [Micromonospora sp. STR1s_5]|nr:TfoX/Sxy family protein [Micromonospora sp. STR1s_5]
MAYDEALADCVRELLTHRTDISERKMIGALCFLVGDRMACGVTGAALMVRVGREAQSELIRRSYIWPMRVGARAMAGFVRVDVAELPADESVMAWVLRGVEFASTVETG